MFFNPLDADAFSVTSINDTGGVLSGQPYYDSVNDEIRIDFVGTQVVTTIHAFNPPTGTVRESNAPSGTWYTASGFTCVGTYDFTAKDTSGTTLLTMTLTVEEGDLVSPRCDSGSAGETSPDCATAVCECIETLKTVLSQDLQAIKQVVIDNGTKLDGVNNNLNDLKTISTGIKDGITAFHGEFQSTVPYSVSPMPDPSYLKDMNQPVQPTTVFKDSTTYFSDNGDAPPVGKLPQAPEPTHWEGFLPETALPPDAERLKDSEKILDSELQLQPEKTLDTFVQDGEMVKDVQSQQPEMIQDSFVQDGVLLKDVIPIQDGVMVQDTFTQDGQYSQTHVYTQTNVYP